MTFNFLYHPLVLAVAASCVPVSTALSQLAVSLSISGAKLDFVWVPLDAPEGAKRVEIGDFSGKHPKERKRSESIYAPFEQNGKRGYYLGKTEVTAEQWAAVTGQGSPSKLPVTGKTYTEIQEFLDKLNGLVRESGDIPRTPDGAEGIVKLPTEAEWEYAVRGAEGPAYKADDPYEGDLERYEVFYLPGSDGKAKEVGSRPPNNLGLHDMLGNVRELMDGSYSVGGVAGGGFLLKGGSYLSERAELRSSGRAEQQRLGKDGKPSRRPDAGLRLCLSAEIFTSLTSGIPASVQSGPEDGRDTRIGDQEVAAKKRPLKSSLKVFLSAGEREVVAVKAHNNMLTAALACVLEESPYSKPTSSFVVRRDAAVKLLERAASSSVDEGASARILAAERASADARQSRIAKALGLRRKIAALDNEIKRLRWNKKIMLSVSPLTGRRSGSDQQIDELEKQLETTYSDRALTENLEQEIRSDEAGASMAAAEKMRDLSFSFYKEGHYIHSLLSSALCRIESSEVFNSQSRNLPDSQGLSPNENSDTVPDFPDTRESRDASAESSSRPSAKDSEESPRAAYSLADLHQNALRKVWSIRKVRSLFDSLLAAGDVSGALETLGRLEIEAEHMPEFQDVPVADRKKLVSMLRGLNP